MRSVTDPLQLVASPSFPAATSLALLVVVMGVALQAQSSAKPNDAPLVFPPNAKSQIAASQMESRQAEASIQILPVIPFLDFINSCAVKHGCAAWFSSLRQWQQLTTDGDVFAEGTIPSSAVAARNAPPRDFNQSVYFKNKLEFSLDGGWLPINIPFVFDVFLGDAYTMTSLRYTLVPLIGSVRWQIDDVGGPWIFRGNWDLECSGAVTFIPRGPETRYFAWILGFRRNFVPRRGKIAPYFDGRVGLGSIDAKGPAGVLYAQGQDFTFTMNMGSGVRYNFNPRYSLSAGLNWMHISNLYLSEPKFSNYGINVYGPMFGINVRLGRLHRHDSE